MRHYKSQKSDNFRMWLYKSIDEAHREQLEGVILLEKMARMLVHNLDISGEIRPQDLHNLARASKKLEAIYEQNAGN